MKNSKTILLIDDEIDLVESLQDLLTQSGYKIFTAFNGIEGLKRLSQCRPDLIVLDMNMPIMGGLAFIQQLTQSQKRALPCPLLILSARINLESVFKDLHIEFMAKPFQLDDLLKKIESMLPSRAEIKKETKPETQDESAPTQTPSAAQDSNMRVLIIAKDGRTVHQLSALFEASDYQVQSAATGSDGLNKAAIYLPDFILIHMDLDDIPGDVIALKLKMLPKITDIPVILYTEKGKFPDNFTAASRIYEKLNVKTISNVNDLNELFIQCIALIPRPAK